MSIAHAGLEDFGLLMFSILSVSYILSASSSVEFSEPEKRDLMEIFHLGLSVPKATCLVENLLFSVFLPICYRRKFA